MADRVRKSKKDEQYIGKYLKMLKDPKNDPRKRPDLWTKEHKVGDLKTRFRKSSLKNKKLREDMVKRTRKHAIQREVKKALGKDPDKMPEVDKKLYGDWLKKKKK